MSDAEKLVLLGDYLDKANKILSELVTPKKRKPRKDLYIKQAWYEAAVKQFQRKK